MATLKVKKIKGHEYFYWSKSVRSRKRHGGSGQVRTIDHLIGNHPLGNWLAYRLWTGEAQLTEYAEAVIQWVYPDIWKHIVKVSIDWKRQRVTINSLVPLLVDCRQRCWKRERGTLQGWLNQLVSQSTWIDSIIERAAYYLASSNEDISEAKKLREFAKDARLNPDKYKPDADLYLDEYASESEAEADKLMQRYLEVVNDKLLVFAPPKKRSQFRYQVISKVEKLAKDQSWLEEYQAKLDRS